MKIGEVIRKYRKEKGLTQEEMAGRLGVSAPAVNKWENNVSLPDVSLLAPIARLLEITTDTLLSYKDELTDAELNQRAEEFVRLAQAEGFDNAWSWAQKQIQEYPNSETLIMLMVQMMDGYRMILGVKDAEQYTQRLYELYDRLLHSQNVEIRQEAAVSFFHNCLRDNNFEKAEECLSCIPKRSFNLKLLQAKLCNAKKRARKRNGFMRRCSMPDIWTLPEDLTVCMPWRWRSTTRLMRRCWQRRKRRLSVSWKWGAIRNWQWILTGCWSGKIGKKCWLFWKNLQDNIDSITDFRNSSLYAHMKFSAGGGEGVVQLLKQGLENDESLDFVRDDERFGRIIKKLEAFIGDK